MNQKSRLAARAARLFLEPVVPARSFPILSALLLLGGAGLAGAARSQPSASVGSTPAQHSPAPTQPEWENAHPGASGFALNSRLTGPRARGCRIQTLREWLRISCREFPVSAITHVGGDASQVGLALEPADAQGLPRGGTLTFPLRPGQARVFMIWSLGPGYDGPLTVIPGLVVQTEWYGPDPTLILVDALHEPVPTARGLKRAEQSGAVPAHFNPTP